MSELQTAFDRLTHPRLLVVGDIILDRYTWGNIDRVSPEAPVLILNIDHREVRLGGAASVAYLAKALEADVSLIGVIGDDSSGRIISQLLTDEGIDNTGVRVSEHRPTTTKERFIGRAAGRHPNQILRVDEESTEPIDSQLEETFIESLQQTLHDFDAVLISDYAKGVCTPRFIRAIIDQCRAARIPVLVDPARNVDIGQYRGTTIIKANRVEAEIAIRHKILSPDQGISVAQQLTKQFDIDSAVITLDCEGMVFATNEGSTGHFPTTPREVYDITGAGDLSLAVLGLASASAIPLPQAIQLANVAAGLEVERHGVAAITRREISASLAALSSTYKSKLVTLPQARKLSEDYRQSGRRVVVTNGCFDLLHAGHVTCLQQAASFGDLLFVAINSDQSIRTLKGPSRPIYSEVERIAVLSALDCVDHVLVFEEPTPHELLEQIRPHVLVKGGTYRLDDVVGREIVERHGGEVRLTDVVEGKSTSATILRCQPSNVHVESSYLPMSE